MKIVFLSNALSHHQVPFCDAISSFDGVDFTYVATKPITKERLKMGYTDYHKQKDYVLTAYESKGNYKRAKKLVAEADAVICGSVPLGIILGRVFSKKPIFWGSERIYKKEKIGFKNWLFRFVTITLASKKNTRLLAASAYAPQDFIKFGLKAENAYKWGYFPPIVEDYKGKTAQSIIWVGRFVSYKYPCLAISLAEKLKAENYDFSLTMVGGGAMDEELRKSVEEKGLSDRVKFTGYLSNEETRNSIGKSEIMICTSDRQEGWGAVVNEGMSAGCAVVASKAMGATPFLIKDGENGYLFESGNEEELYEKVSRLLASKELTLKIGSSAREYIEKEYNGEVAAKRLIKLLSEINGNPDFKFEDGILSAAPSLK
ncbi:MAG: glycosyltransferase [Clostridia bacterium]|nr:glycosyltransferase [Clostridia bacterium]